MNNATKFVQALYASFADGDIETVLAAFDSKIKFTEAEGFPYGGTYFGPKAVLDNVFMKLGADWEDWKAVPQRFVAEGDTVVALGEYSGKYRATGKSVRVPFVHVWTLQGNRVMSFEQHTDTALVQKALA